MEKKYPVFVAYAAVQAYAHVSALLEKHQIPATQEIIEDAARFGQQRALDAMFPGLMRVPFQTKPLADIILALRYQFEGDPEGVQAMMKKAEESSVRERRSSTVVPKLRPEAPAVPPQAKDDTGVRRRDASGTGWRLAANARNADTSVRRLNEASETSRYNVAPGVELGSQEPNPEAARFLSAEVDDESSRGGVGAGMANGSVSQTKLRKIQGAPVFPWEKKKPTE